MSCSSCSTSAHSVQPASSVPLLFPTPPPLVPSLPLQQPPHGGAPWQRQLWCHMCLLLVALGAGTLLLKTNSCLHPHAGSHRAPHLQEEWQYWDVSLFVTLLTEQEKTPALPHTLGLHPWPHAARSPAGRHVSLAPMQIALPALFGRGGRKVGRSDIGSSYLQLRNIRAVKLISW